MNEELQNTLKTLAFSFQPFNPDDQKNFLVRYWSQKHLNLTEILQFINSLLQLIELSLKDKWRKFAGIPLQCRMLADIFQEEVSHYCQTGEMRLPQSLNVLQLYDKFIDKKWKFYYKKLNVDGNTAMIQILLQNQKLQLEQSHMICAMVSYFDYEFISNLNSSEDIVKGNQLFIDQFKSGQDKSGIISHITVDGKALFVHRTFAEYFIALWFSQNYENELTGIKNIYFNLNFEIIQKFLDRMLAQEFDLHTAVINQNLPEIEYLLSEQETGVNDEDEGGRTALHLAIINYFYDKIEINDFITNMLLKHGADINCEDKVLHYKPLRLAEELKVWSLVEKLLESQADNRDLVWIRTNIGKQHLLQIENDDIINMEYHMSDALHDVMHTALMEGYINLIGFILKSGVSVQHCINAYGISTTMLHIAAEFGHLRLVQFIIEHGVDCSTCVDEYKRTPLMLAAECDHIQVAEFLINHAAPVTAKDVYGNSALSLAVLEENHEMVKLLLANMSYNIDEKDVVIYAVGYGDMKAVTFLIENNIINSQNQHGNTALILAACLGKIDIVELLLQNGADVQITGQHKRTVLMHAAERGHLQLVKLLIKHGASVNATDEDGYSALSLARRRYNHFAELLLDLGAHE
ncbi:hypothetical protein L9F63_002666 [Diploptera punctata]|uniref:Ankyrin repeat protein n=1 Tax=Diploptera punctata TaxID=6984 RepID=A0AAD7ZRG5_DIPPU|nr:hypothetical protein L9F63_002666 [Diploptera punctata]